MTSIRLTALTRAVTRTLRLGRQLARRISAVLAECQRAQRRVTELRTSPDRYLPEPGHAPDTYAEFLFRTSGTLRHEPAAARRAAGRAVR
ncbi:MAG TPA: hypothetical protein VFV41_11025 [Streptosporangiaceae bacterium]|nr:hypothetical protein [Streptosporangiaceae bacterium]